MLYVERRPDRRSPSSNSLGVPPALRVTAVGRISCASSSSTSSFGRAQRRVESGILYDAIAIFASPVMA